MPKQDQVAEGEVEEVSDEETPLDGGVSDETEETPEQPEIDVEALKREYDEKLARSQKDLDKMKSSFQSNEAKLRQEYEKRQKDMEKLVREARLANMDEEQRKAYEEQMASEEMQTLQEKLNSLAEHNQELEQTLNAQKFFVSKGIPAEALVMDQGYDAMAQSGWDWLTNQLTELRAKVAEMDDVPTKKKANRKAAPQVVTDKSVPSKTTWPQLIKQFGSEEEVWMAVENGRLDPSQLPS